MSGVKAFILAFARATAIASLAIGALSLVVANAAGVTSQQLQIVIQASILASLTAFTGLFAAELRGLGALLKGQSMDIMVRPMVTFVIIGALLLGGARLDALLALMIQNAVTLAAVVVSGIWLWRSIPPQFRRDPPARLHPWIGVALPLAAVDVLRVLDGSCSLVIVSWLSSASDLGVFRVAVACGVLAAMPVTIFHILLAPTLSRLHAVRSTQQMQSVLTWAAASMTAITLVVSVAAWFLGKSAISLVFGPVYAGAWLPLFILVQFVYAVFGMGPSCGDVRRGASADQDLRHCGRLLGARGDSHDHDMGRCRGGDGPVGECSFDRLECVGGTRGGSWRGDLGRSPAQSSPPGQ